MHKIVEKRVFDKKNFAKSLEWDNARHLSNIFKTRQFSWYFGHFIASLWIFNFVCKMFASMFEVCKN